MVASLIEPGPDRTPVDRAPTLAEAGIDKHVADRARKYAAIPQAQFGGLRA
jgi:hypothetical protein